MELKKTAVAGTTESGDVQIILSANPEGGINITLDSVVKAMFGDAILATIHTVRTNVVCMMQWCRSTTKALLTG
jgi:citrate lyase subunit gamma (acyl carrier protein)